MIHVGSAQEQSLGDLDMRLADALLQGSETFRIDEVDARPGVQQNIDNGSVALLSSPPKRRSLAICGIDICASLQSGHDTVGIAFLRGFHEAFGGVHDYGLTRHKISDREPGKARHAAKA